MIMQCMHMHMMPPAAAPAVSCSDRVAQIDRLIMISVPLLLPLLAGAAEPPPPCYEAAASRLGPEPVLSWLGGTSDFLFAFNPSWVPPSSATGGRQGLLVRAQNCSLDGGLNGSYLGKCGPHCVSALPRASAAPAISTSTSPLRQLSLCERLSHSGSLTVGAQPGGPGGVNRGGRADTRSCDAGCPASPSRIAFAELQGSDGDSAAPPRFGRVSNASVVFEPLPGLAAEQRGVEDPRLVFDAHADPPTYHLLYTSAYHTHIASHPNPTAAKNAEWRRSGVICPGT
eukprot:SAG22_NODE_33_length_27588_cov_104.174652_16_plen_285_part_00